MRVSLGRVVKLAALLGVAAASLTLPGSLGVNVANAAPVAPIDDPAYTPKLQALLREYTVGGDGIPSSYLEPQLRMLQAQDGTIQNVLQKARVAAATEPEEVGLIVKSLPIISRVTTVGAIAYGAYVTYKVLRTHPDGVTDFVTRWVGCFIGDCGDYGPAANPATPVQQTCWSQIAGSSSTSDWYAFTATVPWLAAGTRVDLFYSTGVEGPVTPSAWSISGGYWQMGDDGCRWLNGMPAANGQGFGTYYADPEVAGSGASAYWNNTYAPDNGYQSGYTQANYRATWQAAWDYVSALTLGTFSLVGGTSHCSYANVNYGPHNDHGHCWHRVATNAQIKAYLKVGEAGNPNQTVATTGGTGQPSVNYTIPSDAATGAKLTAAVNIIKGDPATKSTVNKALDPAFTVAMPNCYGLTYTACVNAVRGIGITGAITSTVVGAAGVDTNVCGGCVVQQIPGASTQVDPQADVTIKLNPDTVGDPVTTAPQPLALPAPLPNETAEEYLQRLRAMGWIGHATVTIWDPSYDPSDFPDGYSPALGPGAPALITVGSTTLDLTLGAAWPINPPIFAPGADITIQKNPTQKTNGDPVPAVSGGSTAPTCNCPAVDFSPLTSLDFGSRFPFGVFGYVTSTLDLFNVDPQAPGFDINVTANGTAAHPIAAPGHFTGSLDFLDTYMGWLRMMETFALWVGAVWYVGSRMLGFGSSGDLSEAMDDGSVV